MAKGNAAVDGIRVRTEALVAYVRRATAASGPETQRSAALAIAGFESGVLWAGKAFASSDFVVGDDGGAQGATTEEHDGQSDP
jgi:hypothetical protein